MVHTSFAGHSSALQHFFSAHSVFWQAASLHSPFSAFLQQPIAIKATAAINKIFFITQLNLLLLFYDDSTLFRKIAANLHQKLHICKKNCTFAEKILYFSLNLNNMARKINWLQTKWGFVLINITIAIVVLILLFVGLKIFLRHSTEHGIEVKVPNVTGYYLEEAKIMLAKDSLRIEVIDSTYSTKVPLGAIVEQDPLPGSNVKHGRTIYVIQNAKFRPKIILPEVRDLSLVRAEAILRQAGLTVDSIIEEPSTYKVILDVRQGDVSLPEGTRLNEGETITLVMGRGIEQETTVPNVIGRSLEDARKLLQDHSLTLGNIEYDVEPTEENRAQYVVYSMQPEAGTQIVGGEKVNIKLSIDLHKIFTSTSENEEEDFF